MIEVKVCCGLDCTARGGQELIHAIEQDPVMAEAVTLVYEKCMEKCKIGELAPVMEIDGQLYTNVTAEAMTDLLYALIARKNAGKEA